MSTNIKKTLAATLAASIAAGMVSVPAMATPAIDGDALYAVAYEATIQAQKTGTQEDINAARTAIAALEGTTGEFAIGEFSKLVDAPQQVILTAIVDGILAQTAAELPSQEKINEIRAMIVELPKEDWRNSYSSALDAPQQTLINNAVAAAEKAEKSGLQADIDAANGLLDTLKTATNNEGVVKWATDFQADFNEKVAKLDVSGVTILNAQKIRVDFSRAVDAKTVDAEDFKISKEDDKYGQELINEIVVSEDKKSVEITLVKNLAEGKYNVVVSDIADERGVNVEENKTVVEYKKAAATTVKFKSTNIYYNAADQGIINVKDYVKVTDANGRDITSTMLNKLEITTNNTTLVNTDGVVQTGVEGNVKVTVSIKGTNITTGDIVLNIEKLKATTFQDIVYVSDLDDAKDKKLSEIKAEDKLTQIKNKETAYVVAFYKDQEGNEMKAITSGNHLDIINAGSQKYLDVTDTPVGIKVTPKAVDGTHNTSLVVKHGKFENAKAIKVVPTSKVTSIEVADEVIELATTKDGVTTRVNKPVGTKILDQYKDVVNASVNADGNIATGTFKLQELVDGEYVDALGDPDALGEDANRDFATVSIDLTTGVLTVNSLAEEGKETFRVVYTQDDIEYTDEFTVEVKGYNQTINYKVGFATDKVIDFTNIDTDDEITLDGKVKIDVDGFNIQGHETDVLDISVVAVAKDGKALKTGNKVGIEILRGNTDGDITLNTTHFATVMGASGDTKNASTVGTYTIELRDNTGEFATFEVEVDDAKMPTTAKFVGNGVVDAVIAGENDAEKGEAIGDALLAEKLVELYNEFGKKIELTEVDDIKVTKAFSNNETLTGNTADVTIQELTVTIGDQDYKVVVPNRVITVKF